jgi:hypothetical protein
MRGEMRGDADVFDRNMGEKACAGGGESKEGLRITERL